MKKVLLVAVCCLVLILVSGCSFKTDNETADKYGDFFEWFGFEKCEGEC